MSFFDRNFPGVRDMLDQESQRSATRRPDPGKPWCVTGLDFGRRVIESCHATEADAKRALIALQASCAPFIRDTFRVDYRP